MKKLPLWKEAGLPTLFALLTLWLINFFPAKFEFVKPIKQELGDFDIYDLHFSGRTHSNHTRDSNIIIVQVADTRAEIAKQLVQLNSYHPSVIGIDVDFNGPREDSVADRELSSIILNNPHIISGYLLSNEGNSGGLRPQLNYFDNEGSMQKAGYFNFIGEKISVVRNYTPFLKVDQSILSSFTSRILENYDAAAYARMNAKGTNHSLLINYSGNTERFTVISKAMLMEDSARQLAEIISGKIVLLGVIYPKAPQVLDDLHYSPLNDKITGKSFPDMYGVVIHANILSMAISNRYFKITPAWFTYLLCGILIFMITAWQVRAASSGKHIAHWKLIVFQFGAVFLITYICLLCFSNLRFRIDLLPLILTVVVSVELFGPFNNLSHWLMSKMNKNHLKHQEKTARK